MRKICGFVICTLLIISFQPLINAGSVIVENNEIIPLVKKIDNTNWVLMFYQNGDNKLSAYIFARSIASPISGRDHSRIISLLES